MFTDGVLRSTTDAGSYADPDVVQPRPSEVEPHRDSAQVSRVAGRGSMAFPAYGYLLRRCNVQSRSTLARSLAILRITRWVTLESGRQYDRRRPVTPESRRTRSAQALCSLLGGGEARGAVGRDSRQDRERLRNGRSRGRSEHHARAKEDWRFRFARFSRPLSHSVSDKQIGEAPFYKPAEDGPEMQYIKERMRAMGGSIPSRRRKAQLLEIPPLNAFEALLKSTEDREISTTMAFVRILNTLIRDRTIGKFVVPIVPDECRTFPQQRAGGVPTQSSAVPPPFGKGPTAGE
jgi:hypothetical protein